MAVVAVAADHMRPLGVLQLRPPRLAVSACASEALAWHPRSPALTATVVDVVGVAQAQARVRVRVRVALQWRAGGVPGVLVPPSSPATVLARDRGVTALRGRTRPRTRT